MKELIIIAAIVGFVLLGFLIIYNGLVGRKNRVEQAFSGMDVMLKKRFDLVPNLVATVKQYMRHEADTLTRITELRSQAVSGGASTDQRINVENQLSRALGGIMVAVENYPQLKADANFRQLQGSLNEVEEQISAARRAFNASVVDYNNAVEMLPSSIIASMMGYRRREVFEVPQEQRENVNVANLFSA
jgi:LemA protein